MEKIRKKFGVTMNKSMNSLYDDFHFHILLNLSTDKKYNLTPLVFVY